MKTSTLALGLSLAAAAVAQTANDLLWAKLNSLPTQVERIKALNDSDFVFSFIDPTDERTTGAGGFIAAANAATFPALIKSGMAMALGVLGPCTMNSPHTHPRATEFNVALNGSLYTGMLAENGARFVVNNVPTLSATFFPKGAIHFEANLGCEPVYFIAAFNDEDPGVLQVAQRFFGLPPDVVGVSLGGLGVEDVVAVSQMIPDNIIFAMDSCFTTCGITKPAAQPIKQQQPRVSGNAFPSGSGAAAPPPAMTAAAPPPAMTAAVYPPMGMGAPAPAAAAPAGAAYPSMMGAAPPAAPAATESVPAGRLGGSYHAGSTGYSIYTPNGGQRTGGAPISAVAEPASSGGIMGMSKDVTKILVIVILAINGALVVGLLVFLVTWLFRRRKSSGGRGVAASMGGGGAGGKYGRTMGDDAVVFSMPDTTPHDEHHAAPPGASEWYDPYEKPAAAGPGGLPPREDAPQRAGSSPQPGNGARRSY